MNNARWFWLYAPLFGISPLPADEWQTTLSGQARTMYEGYQGLDLGLGPVSEDDWVHQRIQTKLVAEKDDFLTLAAELTWGKMWGRQSSLAPPDEDHVDFLQLYSQFRIIAESDDTWEVRAGRQELYYGSGRLLAAREGANQRLAHDALRISWLHGGTWHVDGFLASPSHVNPEAFDNLSEPSEIRFWGIYSTLTTSSRNLWDFYYIGLRDEDSIFTSDRDHETRHTFGTRYATNGGPLICNTELIGQYGEAGGRRIAAGAASLGIGWKLEGVCWQPSLILRADAISGGENQGSVHTFNPLFQANNYFNEGGFLSPSNLYNLNPVLVLKPMESITVNFGVNFQWRFDADDAVYGPPLQSLGGPSPDGSTYLGTAVNFSIEWAAAPATTLFFGYTHHDAGPSLTSIGGTDVDYLQFSIRRTF